MKGSFPIFPAAMVGAAILFLAFGRKEKSEIFPKGFTEKDVDHMARTLWVETALRHDPEEVGQITWVAINRSKKYNKPVAEVVHPDASPTWFGRISDKNRARWHAFDKNPHYEKTKEFVRQIFLGKAHPNKIGSRSQFLHPTGMPSCLGEPGTECSVNRICTQTNFGRRCLPKWSNEGHASIVNVGKARFS